MGMGLTLNSCAGKNVKFSMHYDGIEVNFASSSVLRSYSPSDSDIERYTETGSLFYNELIDPRIDAFIVTLGADNMDEEDFTFYSNKLKRMEKDIEAMYNKKKEIVDCFTIEDEKMSRVEMTCEFNYGDIEAEKFKKMVENIRDVFHRYAEPMGFEVFKNTFE